MRTLALTCLAALIASLATAPADAKRKRKAAGGEPACDASYFPFVEGQVMVYELIPAEKEPVGPRAEWPSELKIEVKEIKRRGKSATITLVESFRKHSVETEITCSEAGFRISPHSFFFVGEAGGAIGMELQSFKQDQADLPGPMDFRTGQVWTVYIKAGVKRDVKAETKLETGDAKIEIDRQLRIGARELVETGLGDQRAYRLDVMLSGRAAIDPVIDKWVDLPTSNITLWLAPGLGVVRAMNRYGHGWELKSRTVNGDDAE
jgi:hypothetical protein